MEKQGRDVREERRKLGRKNGRGNKDKVRG